MSDLFLTFLLLGSRRMARLLTMSGERKRLQSSAHYHDPDDCTTSGCHEMISLSQILLRGALRSSYCTIMLSSISYMDIHLRD